MHAQRILYSVLPSTQNNYAGLSCILDGLADEAPEVCSTAPSHPYRSLFFSPAYLQVLSCILDGLADEAEGVRDAALAAGRIAVELYATTALPLLLPAVEEAIVSNNWRIRQSSVELLGDLLFKVGRLLVLVRVCYGGMLGGRGHPEWPLVASRTCPPSPLTPELLFYATGGGHHGAHPAGPAQRGGGGHQRGGAWASHRGRPGPAEVSLLAYFVCVCYLGDACGRQE